MVPTYVRARCAQRSLDAALFVSHLSRERVCWIQRRPGRSHGDASIIIVTGHLEKY
jgi:hypothetical protein